MAEAIEENFLKGKCGERGQAMAMMAEFIVWLEINFKIEEKNT
jgi:hypothetical protein